MAQRTYRQRVKARLAELQERVEVDQRIRVQRNDENHSLETRGAQSQLNRVQFPP
ncbi:hypothetical protein PDIDSM_1026 [Penicillium digitatum]|nr:hypothetical protein PDIDSM_1026 [Penicillium digitatum]